ncbi:MAG: hypothetical protein H6883_15020 [Rhodobiaceae bacterium]|nr:hypothetical protein [Rhodobiaceae bacterium]MCC0057431.1 hypothetical protein [Rhodobiaceae bacterium]
MIQSIMLFALGFLVAGLLSVLIAPSMWRRAERLTRRRIENTTPIKMADIQADKDQMRAEFAMSARKLELSLEDLKQKAAQRLVEIGRKDAVLDRMRTELGAQRDIGADLSKRIERLESTLAGAERQIREQQTELTKKDRLLAEAAEKHRSLEARIDEISTTADSRKVENVALKTRLQNLEDKLSTGDRHMTRRDAEISSLEARIKELDRSQGETVSSNEKLVRETKRLGEINERLEQQIQIRRDEIVELKRELNAARVGVKDSEKALKGAEATIVKMRAAAGEAEKNEHKLGDAIARREKELGEREKELERARSDLLAQTAAAERERDESESEWHKERVEGALLRERLNDLAAEVGRLAATLDESGDINRMIDDAISSDKEAAAANGNGNGAVRGPATLAERIRALQEASERV